MRRITDVLFASCLAAAIGSSMLNAQSNGGDAGTVAAITRLEQDAVKASLAGRAATKQFTERNVADDFVGGTSFGKWETKAEIIKDAEDPANTTKSMTIRDLKVSTYGSAAVARYRLEIGRAHV